MRTVTGPTENVVIVGAGLGGLACALRLAGTGRQVTVLERADGRAAAATGTAKGLRRAALALDPAGVDPLLA
jgi:2-polyprenyl-6-methoxyphenol hydroxylase-like FAD-dependent oxidoreductase